MVQFSTSMDLFAVVLVISTLYTVVIIMKKLNKHTFIILERENI